MKLIILIIIFNSISLLTVDSYECNNNQTYGLVGDSCKMNGDCYFPNICFENVCSKYKMTGEKCYKKQDCTLNYNFGDCINGVCQLIVGTGDKCTMVGGKGDKKGSICQSSSECINGICKLKKPCNDYNCPLNQFCDHDSTKECKPIPTTIEQIKCKNDNQCPTTHICDETSSKCIEKYSKKIGESCKSSPLLCNVYNGEICNEKDTTCIKNEQYFKECKDDSNCNGGLCVCLNNNSTSSNNASSSKSVCVGPSGQLNNPKCIELENKLQQCLIKEKCNTLSPVACKCFKQYECLQYQCNAIEHYYTYKQKYYNILHCDNQ